MNFEEVISKIKISEYELSSADLEAVYSYQQNIINQLKEELERERSAVDDMAKMFNKCRDNNCNCVNDIAFYRQKERVNFEDIL